MFTIGQYKTELKWSSLIQFLIFNSDKRGLFKRKCQMGRFRLFSENSLEKSLWKVFFLLQTVAVNPSVLK